VEIILRRPGVEKIALSKEVLPLNQAQARASLRRGANSIKYLSRENYKNHPLTRNSLPKIKEKINRFRDLI
jgi:hypothetical protein